MFFKKIFIILTLCFSFLYADKTLITIGNASGVYEDSGPLRFTIQLSQAPGFGFVTVDYKTLNGSAKAGSDYIAQNGSVTFMGWQTSKTVEVPLVDDTVYESTEALSMQITVNKSGYKVSRNKGYGTIYDNDVQPLILNKFSDKGVKESDSDQTLLIPANFNRKTTTAMTLTYHTEDDSALSGSDYVGISDTITIPANSKRVMLPVTIKGDTIPEKSKQFRVIIDAISTGTISDNLSTVTIKDDDRIKVSIGSSNVKEGNSGDYNQMGFKIYLSKPLPSGVSALTINYKTQNGSSPSAIEGSDYIAKHGSVTFNVGEKEKWVYVDIIGDDTIEPDENLKMVISGSSYIVRSQSQSKILNDDGSYPSVDFSTGDSSIVEGNSSSKVLSFHFNLDAPALANSSFEYYTKDGLAKIVDSDYVEIKPTTYFIAKGSTAIDINVTINGDRKIESDESFYLKFGKGKNIIISRYTAKGTILNDDGAFPKLSFDRYHYDIVEGNSTQQNLNFTFSLDKPAIKGSSFDYYTQDNTAKIADNDYQKINLTTHTFVGGERNITIPVVVKGDTNIESDERFYLYVKNAKELKIGQSRAKGVILNDDGTLPTISIEKNSYSIDEGNSSTQILNIQLQLDAPAPKGSSIEYYTQDGSATDGSSSTEDDDYVQKVGRKNIPKGSRSVTLKIAVNGDTDIEPDERFSLYINNPKNLKIGRNRAKITIKNDDAHSEEPFVCSRYMYLSSSKKRGSIQTGKMWLHRIDTSYNPFKFDVVDDAGEVNKYNAIAYSEKDNYIYGLYYRELVKISKTGKVINLGKVLGLPNIYDSRQLFAGASYNGFYYVSDYDKIFKIDLITKAVTTITLEQPLTILDFSFKFSSKGSLLYAIEDGGKFLTIDLSSNPAKVTKIGNNHKGYQFDSTFSDRSDRFFANDSNGNGFFEFNVATGDKLFLSASQSADYNDGANCIKKSLLFNDFGDAPKSYGKARHKIAEGIFLGTKVDHDVKSYFSIDANGDDSNGTDDEDGIRLANGDALDGAYLKLDTTHQLTVTLSTEAYLKIWIDKDINGHFDDTSDLVYNKHLSAGEHNISVLLPNGLTTNKRTYLRARVSSLPSMNPTGFVKNGEVEDYMIRFGTDAFTGTFNVERTDSYTQTINSNKRNAWYTQIVGRDFDYSVVFYEDDMSREKNVSNVTVKVDLVNMDTNITLYSYKFHILDTVSTSRIDFKLPKDLANLPATKNARFRVTYGVDSAGNIVQADCLSNPSLCPLSRSDEARDNFAIRPKQFYIGIADRDVLRKENSNATPKKLRLASGYEYNLTIIGTTFDSNTTASQGYTTSLNGALQFLTKGSCADESNETITVDFKEGEFNDLNFTHSNVGEYRLTLKDRTWTKVDADKGECKVNSSAISSNPNLLSGCDIETISDVNLLFYPYQFGVDLTMHNLPNSVHSDFIYMSEMNATENNVSLQFTGTITAQDKDGMPTTNFTVGCVAQNIVLSPNATVRIDDGIIVSSGFPTKIRTAKHPTQAREDVSLIRMALYNNEVLNASHFANIADIGATLNIPSSKFLDTNNGVMTLDLRYNIKKHPSLPINPIEITFNSLDVSSPISWSLAEKKAESDPYIPFGTKSLGAVRNFYFAQVAPDKIEYPRINFNKTKSIRTPLNVDIFCNASKAYCTQTHVFDNTKIESSPRKQQGWYISSKHDINDGVVTELSATPNIVTTMATPLSFTHGRNGIGFTKFKNCSSSQSVVTIKSSPALSYSPNGKLPYYIVECTTQDASEWTGIGSTGNVLDSKSNVNFEGKMDW